MKLNLMTLISITVFLSACNTTPKILQGEFSNVTPLEAKTKHEMNVPVRWAGYIVNTINKKDKTCFEIVQTQTNKSLRPVKILPKKSSRFLACKEGFLEPQAFNKRMVTITGNLVAYTEQLIGEFNYEYPVVKTDIIYIWRKQNPYPNNNFITNYASFSHFYCSRSFIHGYCF